MASARVYKLSGLQLRCFYIGCLSMSACILDLCLHFFVVAVVTNGFQCDPDRTNLQLYPIVPVVEPIVLLLNLGTHGFYPFPMVLRNSGLIEQTPLSSPPTCYPGMFHVPAVDALYFLINAIWLKFVMLYVRAVYHKHVESMRLFVRLSTLKLVLQIMFDGYQSNLVVRNDLVTDSVWMIKLIDIFIAFFFLLTMKSYVKQVTKEKAARRPLDPPPSYIECLINGPPLTRVDEKRDPPASSATVTINMPVESPKP